LGEGKY
jgi:hypothetical protein